jgi:glycosyltransferase involved in cell wall biosynthesis
VLTRTGPEINAIHEASACLVSALERQGCQARLVEWSREGARSAACDSDVIVIPYNPFMYGRWGFAPALVREALGMRRRRSSRAKLALVVHEPYVPIHDWKSLLMGAWQRAQLGALLLLSDRPFASIEPWADAFSRVRRTRHLPSGSVLPDARHERVALRSELGLADRFVAASLSTGNPSHLGSYVAASLRRIADAGLPITFLELGAGARPVQGIPAEVQIIRPGRLPAERLAAHVAAADLMLTPFVDGVSTRRTSFMAGLQQEVAVAGTSGPLTDAELLAAELELVEVGNADAFAERAAHLAIDEGRRSRAASAGRALFQTRFSWDAIGARFIEGVIGQ